MSEIATLIIRSIITYVLYFLVGLAAALPIVFIETRKMDKYMSESIRKFRENGAAQVDEIHESFDEIHKDIDSINESIDKIDKSLDKMDESMDVIIESKRLMRDYSDYKIKRIEARENFCESQFWDEKNIH